MRQYSVISEKASDSNSSLWAVLKDMRMTVRELLDQLVAFPTVSRDSNLPLIHYVKDYLHERGVESTLVPNDDGTKANLYATIGPHVPGGVVLSGHTDVVPIDGQPWSTDPFTVTEKDGLLYGRGTCDMKAFIAIALALLPEMDTLKRPVHLALSYDEEIGCVGAPRMIKQLQTEIPTPSAVIVGEPTEMQVVTAHKGIVANRTTIIGHEAHSSQTQSGAKTSDSRPISATSAAGTLRVPVVTRIY